MKNLFFAAAIAVSVSGTAFAEVVVTNQAVTLSVVTPAAAPPAGAKTGATPAEVTLLNGVVWSFNGSGNIASAGATLNGVAVAPAKLAAGMKCTLNGTRQTPTGNIITTLACVN
jgi:hypothetical protein